MDVLHEGPYKFPIKTPPSHCAGKPLPFGTLGIHKKSEFKTANVCLFVFDILLLNGKSLVNKPIKKRREILSESITEIPNRVMLSEMKVRLALILLEFENCFVILSIES